MDARGATRREIAETAGVAEGTVTQWRNQQAYVEERDRLVGVTLAKLEPLIQKERVSALEVHSLALADLKRALKAVDDAGGPAELVRARAREQILTALVIRGVLAAEAASAGASASSQSVVQVNIVRRDDVEVIEYLGEVSEDGHREGVGDDQGGTRALDPAG